MGCLAHARRKFFDLQAANQSQIAEFALQQFAPRTIRWIAQRGRSLNQVIDPAGIIHEAA